jgi:hypothetical protein
MVAHRAAERSRRDGRWLHRHAASEAFCAWAQTGQHRRKPLLPFAWLQFSAVAPEDRLARDWVRSYRYVVC